MDRSANHEAQTVIRTGRLFDGLGGWMIDRDLVVADGKIIDIRDWEGVADHDLRDFVTMPGWIDTHTHIAARLDHAGKLVLPNTFGEETVDEAAIVTAEHAYATYAAGFTTVQSPGDRLDGPLRDAIARGGLPGPRILTCLEFIKGGSPEEIATFVARMKETGADFIKIFADGHGRPINRTLDDRQISAACDAASALGMRTIVHAHLDETIQAAVRAGCTSIEHGTEISERSLEMMAAKGTYFDPNLNVMPNYLAHRDAVIGTAHYTEEYFAAMPGRYHRLVKAFRQALALGVKVVFGTDAVYGAHGNNADEFVYRVRDGGQSASDVFVSATSLSAESLGLGGVTGRIAKGYAADLVATGGDPFVEIDHVHDVRFVMGRGRATLVRPNKRRRVPPVAHGDC